MIFVDSLRKTSGIFNIRCFVLTSQVVLPKYRVEGKACTLFLAQFPESLGAGTSESVVAGRRVATPRVMFRFPVR